MKMDWKRQKAQLRTMRNSEILVSESDVTRLHVRSKRGLGKIKMDFKEVRFIYIPPH
jgi:hypothetical protein